MLARVSVKNLRLGNSGHTTTLIGGGFYYEFKLTSETQAIPGIPKLPPASISPVAQGMLLQNGEWYIPDRVMGEFTNEPPSEVNRKASVRNNIALESAKKTQVIDFTCHSLFSANKRGPSGKLYSRERKNSKTRLLINVVIGSCKGLGRGSAGALKGLEGLRNCLPRVSEEVGQGSLKGWGRVTDQLSKGLEWVS